MATPNGRSWKLERASVTTQGRDRPRSNKYSGGDTTTLPPAGDRDRVWVGGYSRADGVRVDGHYRAAPGKG